MDKLLEKSLLYDFYGELLTEHQRTVYESFVFDDMSLAEVAEEQGITRQGVHDLVKRCDKILAEYENKLHLVEKFTNIKTTISSIKELTDLEKHADMDESLRLSNIKSLTEAILEEL
ncbi:MAG: YlxM family DNA-binding protein [Lachnospiraceae bacterium]|nr:YlxM family DNA-binding protein [Lachnospiraceae bacterium]